jgi:hypothetical protein
MKVSRLICLHMLCCHNYLHAAGNFFRRGKKRLGIDFEVTFWPPSITEAIEMDNAQNVNKFHGSVGAK